MENKEIEPHNGRLIVVEGSGDGVGKTTQYNILCDRLISMGLSLVRHHFPSYKTFQGAPVEQYLKGTFGNDAKEISPYFVNGLYALDRACTWNMKLKQAYQEGKVIVLDRYTTSSLIYQSTVIEDLEEKKKFIEFVIDYEYKKLGIKEPDGVIFLFAPIEVVLPYLKNRLNNEGVSNDIYERDIELLKKIHENAMFLADYLSWTKVQCNEGDKMRSKEEINDEVFSLTLKMLKKNGS